LFILSGDIESEDPMDLESVMLGYENYRSYLAQNKQHYPPSAYEFAITQWSDGPSNEDSLHDSWLLKLEISESHEEDQRTVSVVVTFLGAMDDRLHEVNYTNISSYCLRNLDLIHGHGGFYKSEVRINTKSWKIVHEIEWRSGDRWLIECDDIIASVKLLDDPNRILVQ